MNHGDTPYFSGAKARDGKIRRLPCTSFAELVTNYFFDRPEYDFTRKEFNSWSVEERDLRKDTSYVVAATYDYDTEGPRNNENAAGLVLVVLDIDAGQAARDFFESPETIGEHLYPYNYVAFTTAKHTAKEPRIKIAVDVSECPTSWHKPFVRHCASLLGMDPKWKGVRESLVLSQPQFLPPRFKGEKSDDGKNRANSILSFRIDGRALEVGDLPEDASDEAEAEDARRYAADPASDPALMQLLHLPVPGLKMDRVREALHTIDPDTDYQVWTEIARAMRHQFIDEDEAREAFDMFDEWSSGGTKYKGSDATYAKWRSFRAYPKGRVPMTIRTLFHHAAELGGWDNRRLVQDIQQSFSEWLESVEDADECQLKGAERIAAAPFQSATIEETMLIAWQTRLKKLLGHKPSLQTLRKDVRSCKRANAEEKTKGKQLDPWLMPQVFIATENGFFNKETNVMLPTGAFDNKYSKFLMDYGTAEEKPANGRPIITPTNYALNVMDLQRVDRALYDPSAEGRDRIFKWHGNTYLNLFNPNTIPIEKPEYAEKAGKLFRQLLSAIIKEPEYVEIIIDFFAYCAKHPGRKIRWAPLLQSIQGVGKGTLAKILRAVFGGPNVMTVSAQVVASQWTDWQHGHQIYVLEEFHVPGQMRKVAMNTLKPWLTDDVISINKRNETAYQAPNHANCIAFTNHRDAIVLEPNDRRWMVIFSQIQNRSDVLRLQASDHFEQVLWLATDEGASGLRSFFLNRAIAEDFDPDGHAPRTKYAEIVIDESEPADQRTLREYISTASDEWVKSGQYLDSARLMGVSSRQRHLIRELGYEQHGHSDFFIHADYRGDRDELYAQWALSTGEEGEEFEI